MPILIDAHADIAYNMLRYGRDYTRAAAETRRIEQGGSTVSDTGDSLLGWPDYQRGQVALIFSTLYATPARMSRSQNKSQVYKNFDEAHALYRDQLMVYHRLTDSIPDKFRLVASTRDLDQVLGHWNSPAEKEHPVGMVVLIEGAECIRHPSEVEEWYELGVRLIGPAWVGTRFCGGWREPGPLTRDGHELLSVMADLNITLDLSHMDEQSVLQALDSFQGGIVATHANCLSLLPGSTSNRHLSDRIIEGIIERDGVIGVVPLNEYLQNGWKSGRDLRADVTLGHVANHIDHICQIAGNALHAGIGSDFDGGFGVESVPQEIDTVADLQNLVPLLQARGYSDADIVNIFSGNWLARLQRNLPSS